MAARVAGILFVRNELTSDYTFPGAHAIVESNDELLAVVTAWLGA
jgi:hypothetical protein